MAPPTTSDIGGLAVPALQYEITHLWNGEPIPQSMDHNINAQFTLQSKKSVSETEHDKVLLHYQI